jgi:hypothetical protein
VRCTTSSSDGAEHLARRAAADRGGARERHHGVAVRSQRERLDGAGWRAGALWSDWRHFAFIADRTEALATVEAEHRQHAVVELAIRDHKDGPLRHAPSGHYAANAAWCVIAALAANLARWVTLLGLEHATPQAAATLRPRLLVVPGRLVRRGRRLTLRLPARWPWHDAWIECLTRLRALPALR